MAQYFRLSRTAWYGYLFALPLLALYQLTALLANMGERRAVINGADALVQNFLNLIGLHGWLGSWLVLAVVAGILIHRWDVTGRKGPLQGGFFAAMFAESVLYALALGTVVGYITSILLPGQGLLSMGAGTLSFGQKLAASLGAGLYEELVFRVVLTGGVIAALRRFGWKEGTAAVAAVTASSFIFSLFHYVGPHGEPLQVASFMFRFVAGAVLAVLYFLRGFGVAAWSHALYDVFLLAVGRA